ncbi:MAG: hypothetical protein PHY12_11130 [Eubacteriales bacterium]|nr:hypothetical protein [Eubacteriales bacterium]
MRALKWIAIGMAALLLVTLGVTGYFFATANVRIAAYKAEGMQATANQPLFEQLKAQVADETFEGTLFQTGELGSIEDYAFITYTLRLSNQCLVPIDMVEVRVVPGSGDALQIGDLAVHSLGAQSQGDITATILTAKDSHAIRELVVTYYVWGVSFTIQETYGG